MDSKLVFSVHWVSLTVWLGFDELREFIHDFLGLAEGLTDAGHGGIGFSRMWWGAHGFQVYTDPVNVSERKPDVYRSADTYCSLRFPGECIEAIGIERLIAFYTSLLECGVTFNCTRLDAAFDTQLFTSRQVEQAMLEGLVDTRSVKWRPITNYEGSEVVGHTVYFGSRQSPAMLRVYWKRDGHSFGDEDFTRVELELHEERSAFHFIELMAAPICEWGRVAGAWLAAFISIRADWWFALVEGFKAFWLRISRPAETAVRMRRWLNRQVLPTLATVLIADTGGDVDEMFIKFRDMLKVGYERLDGVKRRLIADAGSDVDDMLQLFNMAAVDF